MPEVDPIRRNNELAGGELRRRSLSMEATPQFIELETTTRCNLDCLQCPREPGPAGVDVPEWVLDALAPFWERLQNLSLHGLGEPLMAKRTDDIVRRLPARSHVWFSSNLQILTERHLELLKHRHGAVSCSLDAATAETYALIRGGDLARSLAHIERIRDETSLAVFINMTVMKMNHREVGAFLDLGRRLRVRKVVLLNLNEGESFEQKRQRGSFLFDYEGQHLDEGERIEVARQVAENPVPFPVEDNVNLKVIEPAGVATPPETVAASPSPPPDALSAASVPEEVAVTNPHRDVLCHMPWTNLHVRIDGSVRVCCHQEAFANLEDRRVEEIWNGPEIRAMREAIGKGTLHPLCHRDNCPVFRDWHGRQPMARGVRRYLRAAARALRPLVDRLPAVPARADVPVLRAAGLVR